MPVDRATLADHLRLAERHVADAIVHVERQRHLIEELQRDGHDTAPSRELLALFEDMLRLHVEDRDRLIAQLAQ